MSDEWLLEPETPIAKRSGSAAAVVLAFLPLVITVVSIVLSFLSGLIATLLETVIFGYPLGVTDLFSFLCIELSTYFTALIIPILTIIVCLTRKPILAKILLIFIILALIVQLLCACIFLFFPMIDFPTDIWYTVHTFLVSIAGSQIFSALFYTAQNLFAGSDNIRTIIFTLNNISNWIVSVLFVLANVVCIIPCLLAAKKK